MQVYNVAINPEIAKLELGLLKLIPTQHAKQRAFERNIPLPVTMNVNKGSIVELEADGPSIKKVIVRIADCNQSYDNVYVLFLDFGNLWTILSCYKNHREDNHKTLNKNRLRA